MVTGELNKATTAEPVRSNTGLAETSSGVGGGGSRPSIPSETGFPWLPRARSCHECPLSCALRAGRAAKFIHEAERRALLYRHAIKRE